MAEKKQHIRPLTRDGFKKGSVERLPCPPEKPQGHDRVPQNLGDTILGDTIVSLVVSLNVSPTVSLEVHGRVQ